MESITEQLTTALSIMLMGMGLVFIFLSLLIVGIKVVAKLFPVVTTQSPSTVSVGSKPATTQLEPALVAAITTAVHQYRTKAN
ncbi:OadG family protein [Shewanella maritima]|uniref:OadG family protein n=1 Tax=Shewanella maritima TaxID=2520507 RepID=UPI003735A11E